MLHDTAEAEIARLAQNKDFATIEVTTHSLVMEDAEYARIIAPGQSIRYRAAL